MEYKLMGARTIILHTHVVPHKHLIPTNDNTPKPSALTYSERKHRVEMQKVLQASKYEHETSVSQHSETVVVIPNADIATPSRDVVLTSDVTLVAVNGLIIETQVDGNLQYSLMTYEIEQQDAILPKPEDLKQEIFELDGNIEVENGDCWFGEFCDEKKVFDSMERTDDRGQEMVQDLAATSTICVCVVCNEQFQNIEHLKMHLNVHIGNNIIIIIISFVCQL